MSGARERTGTRNPNPGEGATMNLEVTGGFSRSLFLRAARAAYRAIPFVAAMSVFSSMSAKAATAQVTIEQQPQNATIAAGQTATFTASASAVCRSVWYKNGSKADLRFLQLFGTRLVGRAFQRPIKISDAYLTSASRRSEQRRQSPVR